MKANDLPDLMQLKFLINYRLIIDKSMTEYRKVDIFNKQKHIMIYISIDS